MASATASPAPPAIANADSSSRPWGRISDQYSELNPSWLTTPDSTPSSIELL